MVWFLPVTRLIGVEETKGWGVVFFIFNLPSLPNTLICKEKIHLAQGAVRMRKEKLRNGPYDRALCPTPPSAPTSSN